ncbi:MAG: type II toxin-antitoxin system HicB family antitoxin [Thermodesulfobacteriota bacterium]
MQNFIYPVILIPDVEGGFVANFVDFPEAITQGEDIKGALKEAEDCLEEAIANRIVSGLSIPKPSPVTKGRYLITLPAQTAAKAALYIALQESGISKTELSRRLQCDEKEVRRLLDPRHPSKLPRIEAALAAVGQKLLVSLQDAA